MYRTVVNLLWTNHNVHKTSLQSSIKVDLHEKSRHKQCAPSALWVIIQMAMGLWNPRRLFPVLRQVEKNCGDKIEIAVNEVEIAVVKLKLP